MGESLFEVKSQAIEELIKHWAERQDLCIDGNQNLLTTTSSKKLIKCKTMDCGWYQVLLNISTRWCRTFLVVFFIIWKICWYVRACYTYFYCYDILLQKKLDTLGSYYTMIYIHGKKENSIWIGAVEERKRRSMIVVAQYWVKIW